MTSSYHDIRKRQVAPLAPDKPEIVHSAIPWDDGPVPWEQTRLYFYLTYLLEVKFYVLATLCLAFLVCLLLWDTSITTDPTLLLCTNPLTEGLSRCQNSVDLAIRDDLSLSLSLWPQHNLEGLQMAAANEWGTLSPLISIYLSMRDMGKHVEASDYLPVYKAHLLEICNDIDKLALSIADDLLRFHIQLRSVIDDIKWWEKLMALELQEESWIKARRQSSSWELGWAQSLLGQFVSSPHSVRIAYVKNRLNLDMFQERIDELVLQPQDVLAQLEIMRGRLKSLEEIGMLDTNEVQKDTHKESMRVGSFFDVDWDLEDTLVLGRKFIEDWHHNQKIVHSNMHYASEVLKSTQASSRTGIFNSFNLRLELPGAMQEIASTPTIPESFLSKFLTEDTVAISALLLSLSTMVLILKQLSRGLRWRRFAPVLKQGQKRICWKCKCGKYLWDDFTELQQGAIARHQDLLEGMSTNQTSSSGQALNRDDHNQQSIIRPTNAAMVGNSLGSGSEQRLPQSSNLLTTSNTSHQVVPNELLFLLICIKDGGGRTAFKLKQPIVHTLCTDVEFFTFLNKTYWSLRGKFLSFFSFRIVTSIKFIRLEVSMKGLVGILKINDMPPESNKAKYKFAPVPAEIIPPIGENDLMHLFHHPNHADDNVAWRLSRFPKKLHEQVHADPERGPGMGWGIVFIEDWNVKKIWLVAFCLVVLGSAGFGILWSVFEHSIQDAFSISSYVVGITTLAAGTVQAMIHLY